MPEKPPPFRRKGSVSSAFVAALAAWASFLFLGACIALLVSLVTADFDFSWGSAVSWAVYSTIVAAITSIPVAIIMVAPLALIGRRVPITAGTWPYLVAGAVGAASSLLAVTLLLSSAGVFGTWRTDVVTLMISGYGIGGGVAGAVAWLVFDALTKKATSAIKSTKPAKTATRSEDEMAFDAYGDDGLTDEKRQ